MIKFSLFIGLLIAIFNSAMSYGPDSTKRKEISLFVGVVHAALSDEVFTPISYSGKDISVAASYTAERPNFTHRILLGFSSITLFNDINNNQWLVTNELARYDYLQKIRAFSSNDLRFGLGLKNYVSIRRIVLSGNEEIGYDIFSSIPLNLSCQVKQTSNYQIRFLFSIGTVAYVMGRMDAPKDWPALFTESLLKTNSSPNIGAILKSGELLLPGAYVDIDAMIQYQLQLSNKWALLAQYAFNYYTYEKYETVKSAQSHYQIGLKYIIVQ